MHIADIKAALAKSGYTSARLAQELGLHRCTISVVLNRYGKSRRVANAVSHITGIPVDTLWPGVYRQPRSAKGARR